MDPPDAADDQQVETVKTESKDAYMEILFMSGLNHSMIGQLINDLHNSFRMGRNKYPKDITADYYLEINWKGGSTYISVPPNNGVAFLNFYRGQDV